MDMEAAPPLWLLYFLIILSAGFHSVSSVTDPRDAAALQSMNTQLQNTPPTWDASNDPCGTPWEGVTCNNSRVTALKLSSMGIKGVLGGDIGSLTQLTSLDLSFNRGLTGSLSPRLGDLRNLNILIIVACGFSGNIPDELGNLSSLYFLALNSNNFTGKIPSSLGSLSRLYWLDLSDNQLTGSLPISTATTPGLDLLLEAKHFHFNKNRLSGNIPSQLFSSKMALIHILFDGNQFTGNIPTTLPLVQTLEVLRLDRNHLTGEVPSNLKNLTNIVELNLAHNKLTGKIPDLTGMDALHYVDLSNNSFDKSEAPDWFSTIQSLTTLVMQVGSLYGAIPQKLFSIPQLQQVKLKNNAFNMTLSMGDSVSQMLKLVDLQNNEISEIVVGLGGYKNTIILKGNPVCATPALLNSNYCAHQRQATPYSTCLSRCESTSCPSNETPSPQSCECAFPYEGTFYFRGPSFRELTNASLFHSLEMSLWVKLGLTPGSVSLQKPFFNDDDYLQVHSQLFPSSRKFFTRTEIQSIGFDLTNQTYKPPKEFGPYYFIANPYPFPDTKGRSLKSSVILGIAIGGFVLILLLLGVGAYAIRQKKRADKANVSSQPFASWVSSGKDSGTAPQLKGARWFSFDELKKCTNQFSESNIIGSGGYGKVYKGILSDGQVLAIKRAQNGSSQGGVEFKTEIELLSRVHHKNVVSLVGFCFESGEQILVYEYVAKGTLRDSLTGKSGICLDWKRRLRIALGSARGLSYLHELANPPIIHRDIKSSNILLDENLTAKVADFGLSKLVSDNAKGHVSTQVKGTMGYMDPEYYLTQQLTEKSDVYSFGILMLELVTAKQPIERGIYIVREVKNSLKREDGEHYGMANLMDPMLRNMNNLIELGRFIELAIHCIEELAVDRPSMSEVVKEIETILQNEGLKDNSISISSSSTDYGTTKGTPKNPYKYGQKDRYGSSNEGFDYSGGYALSPKVEPK